MPPMENLEIAPALPVDDELIACERCGGSPEGEQVWHVYWDVDAHGRDDLRALCPDCARAELD